MSDTQLASSTIDGTLGSSGGDHGREKEVEVEQELDNNNNIY